MSPLFPNVFLALSLALIPRVHADQAGAVTKKVSVKIGGHIDPELTQSVYALVESGDAVQALRSYFSEVI